MGTNSNISWTDHTWNPWIGCTKISDACKNCYMYRGRKRWGQDPSVIIKTKTFEDPIKKRYGDWKWKLGSKVFVCSWSDFWHPAIGKTHIPDWKFEAFDIMRRRPDLKFLILTKRPELAVPWLEKFIAKEFHGDQERYLNSFGHLWHGVTVESNKYSHRMNTLLEIPSDIRFVSCEPLLGYIDLLEDIQTGFGRIAPLDSLSFLDGFGYGIDWVIAGGESGSGARPSHPNWFRKLRDDCEKSGVPFFFKQWGEWAPLSQHSELKGRKMSMVYPDGDVDYCHDSFLMRHLDGNDNLSTMVYAGKKQAGKLLDDKEWVQMPGEGRLL